MMPYVNGFEILEYIRSNERFEHLPVVVLTSSSDAPTRLKALEMGATDFLAKPVDESELVLRVRNTLNAKAYQDRLTYFDRLTGLPNRQMLTDNLEWAIEQSGGLDNLVRCCISTSTVSGGSTRPSARQWPMSCCNTWRAGWPRCCTTAVSPACSPRPTASPSLAGSSGDEFSLLVTGNHRPEDLARIARSLLQSMAEPFRLRGQDLYLAINIGIATFPGEDIELNRIQGNAGIAVRSLRTDQPNPEGAFCFYAPELNARAQKRLDLETELRHAIERHELQLYYQPKYDVATETVIGAECLMRWLHPQRGFISPGEFIPLAEETGLILEMGRHVLEEACRQLAEWTSKGLDAGMLAVNVSVQQFRHPGFVEQVRDALSRFGVAASRIKIEVTESLLMTEQEQATRMLNELRALGLHMSIDDFGTGYSSLSYLRTLPIDELKIDRSFLIDVATSSDSAAIVRAVLALAHSLDMEVVAEGVETRDQLDFLREHGCDAFQGFLFSKAVPRLSSKRCSLRQPVVDGPALRAGPRCGPRNDAPRATAASSAHGADLRPGRARPRADRADSRLALPRFRQPRRCQPCARPDGSAESVRSGGKGCVEQASDTKACDP